jgi:hypothetical protein
MQRMQYAMLVLWPSFLAAGIAEILFFTLVNPQELYIFGEPVYFSAIATYSIGFFAFWALTTVSSMLTMYLNCRPGESECRVRGVKC